MAKKKETAEHDINAKQKYDGTLRKEGAFSSFLLGKRSKWLYILLYFIVTVFLFKDFIFSGNMLFGNDTIPDGIYTRQLYKEYHAEYGGIPRWNGLVLGGLPFIDAMHGDTFYPGAWLKFFLPLTRALGHKLVWHVFLAGIFMYAFLRTLRLRRDVSFLGGLMYMLAPAFVTLVYPGHDAKMYVSAFLPLAFAFLEIGMSRGRFWPFAALGGIMGLLILTSHVQMAYYSYWAIGLYFIFRLFTVKNENLPEKSKKTAYFVVAVVLAVSLGAVQLLPSYKFTTSQSVRAGSERTGYDYATSWSMHAEEAASLLVPSFCGKIDGRADKDQVNLYWGKNSFKLNTEYIGITVLLLAFFGLIFMGGAYIWFFAGTGVLSLIYALGAGTPVYKLFYYLVPGIKHFRAPSMMIFLFSFAMTAMAAIFLSGLLDNKCSPGKKSRWMLYFAGAIIIAGILISGMGESFFKIWTVIFYSGIDGHKLNTIKANVPFFTKDMWTAILFSAVSIGGVWLFIRRKITSGLLIAGLSLAVFADCAIVDSRFITTLDPTTSRATAPDKTVTDIRDIMGKNPPFRVLTGLTVLAGVHNSPNYYAMFGIQAADGSHNNELQRYELFRGGKGVLSSNYMLHWLDESFSFNPDGIKDNNFLKVAGVKYIIVPQQAGRTTLLENPQAFERVFPIRDFVVCENDTAAVEMLKDKAFDPKRTLILSEKPSGGYTAQEDSSAILNILSMAYSGDKIKIGTEYGKPGFLVLSENWVPYWKAFVDGNPVKVYRAYETFMAVELPAGKHDVEFTFVSGPFESGKKISLASFALIMLILIFNVVTIGIRNRRSGIMGKKDNTVQEKI